MRAQFFLSLVVVTAVSCEGSTEPRPPSGGGPAGRPSLAETWRPSGRAAAGDVFVHLFDWRWNDVATECETVLGPAGFAAVQVSPPQEHSLVPTHDWSERYQPVSYSIAKSRSGTGAEFESMVNRCGAVGVGIIVDAVINHMTSFPSPGIGSNGTSYTKYHYPGLYTTADFHTPCALDNYQSAANVQDCELFSLPDLNTSLPTVRQKISDYLIMLARLGVAGFRIDAAKHIQQVDLDEILDRLNTTRAGEGGPLPYVFLEFVGNGQGEALAPHHYFGEGYSTGGAADVTEFTFIGVGDKFRRIGGQGIWQLNPEGNQGNRFSEAAWGMMPTDKAVVFLQNHDTQHACGLGYKDGDVYRLAHVWMLAQPYGYPSILSSFAFDCPLGNSMGPPSDAQGNTKDVSCASRMEIATVGQWVCEHRDPFIRNMVRFRRYVTGTSVNHWWDNGANAIAFTRGDKGFVVINLETTALSQTVSTGLAPGSYCDLITGGLVGGSCAGTVVVVNAAGSVQLDLSARTAVAITTAARLVPGP